MHMNGSLGVVPPHAWDEFRRIGLAEGKSEAQLQQDFTDLVNDPNVECRWARNQTLVPRFIGIVRKRGWFDKESSKMQRVANAQNATQLQSAIASGHAAVDHRIKQYEATGSTGNRRLPANQPRFDQSLQSEQPQPPRFHDSLAPHIMREVCLGCKCYPSCVCVCYCAVPNKAEQG